MVENKNVEISSICVGLAVSFAYCISNNKTQNMQTQKKKFNTVNERLKILIIG